MERDREFARVFELVEDATSGEFGFAVVEGPPGIGKSAILNVLASRADEQGMRVLRASGPELERGHPFGVVRQLFEPVLYELDDASRREVFGGAARQAESLLTGRGADSGPLLGDPEFALLHSLYWALVGLTDLGPVALVVDDVHWADRLSLRFLAFVLKRSDELPLLVSLACRDAPRSERSDALMAVLSGRASVIRPAALSADAIRVLLELVVGRQLEGEVVAEAERLTDGNALYVRELADSLSVADGAAAADPIELLRNAAPAAIDRRVETELARLDGDGWGIAWATAILGEDVPLRRAAVLAEVALERASVAADVLARAGILGVGEPLRFRHPLVREAVLKAIEPRVRARAHGRAARLLVAEGEPSERAAVHLLESDPEGDPAVVSVLLKAAKNASVEAAPELAIAALRRALLEPPTAADRTQVLKELAIIEQRVGDPQASEHMSQAFASAASLADVADGAVPYALSLAFGQGKFAEAEALAERVCEALEDREQRLTIEGTLCALAINFEIPGARERLARITTDLRGETPAERLLLGLRANAAVNAGEISASAAAPLIGAALGSGRLITDMHTESAIYVQLIRALLECDALDLLEPELAVAAAEVRRRGDAILLAWVLALRAVISWRRGKLLSAEADARTAAEIADEMGWGRAIPVPFQILLDILIEEGAVEEAQRLFEEHGAGGQLPDNQPFTLLLGVRGRLRLSQGRTEEGIADLELQRARLAVNGDSPPYALASLSKSLVPALVAARRMEEAREVADDALIAARASGVPRYIAQCLRPAALACPDGPDIDQLRAAAAICEDIGAPIDLARALVDIGSALRRRRQPAAAREPLRRALDLARASGARPIAERAEHELRAAGGRPRRDRITSRDALTATERRVAHLATEGMTNRQIAETLFVTRKTVESHLEHIYRKLNIHARGELQQALAAEQPSATGD